MGWIDEFLNHWWQEIIPKSKGDRYTGARSKILKNHSVKFIPEKIFHELTSTLEWLFKAGDIFLDISHFPIDKQCIAATYSWQPSVQRCKLRSPTVKSFGQWRDGDWQIRPKSPIRYTGYTSLYVYIQKDWTDWNTSASRVWVSIDLWIEIKRQRSARRLETETLANPPVPIQSVASRCGRKQDVAASAPWGWTRVWFDHVQAFLKPGIRVWAHPLYYRTRINRPLPGDFTTYVPSKRPNFTAGHRKQKAILSGIFQVGAAEEPWAPVVQTRPHLLNTVEPWKKWRYTMKNAGFTMMRRHFWACYFYFCL